MSQPNITPLEQGQDCCQCPFCHKTLQMPYPFCQACGAEIRRCPVCGKVLPQDVEECDRCAESAAS